MAVPELAEEFSSINEPLKNAVSHMRYSPSKEANAVVYESGVFVPLRRVGRRSSRGVAGGIIVYF